MNQVIVLSGPPGAGKSAVAEALCERFDRMLHIEVDALRHWVRAGYRHPWAGDQQAAEQLELATRNACAIARESLAMRYAAVITDVALPPQAVLYRDLLTTIAAQLPDRPAAHFVTLLPRLDVALDRVAAPGIERARALHAQFTEAAASGALPGLVLDSSPDDNAAQTADRVQDAVSRGLAVLRGATDA